MNIAQFLFANKVATHVDPIWLLAPLVLWGFVLLIVGIWGKKAVDKEEHKALYKTLKKSGFWLKFFAILTFILIWFRLESLRFFSMKFWWVLYAIGFLVFVIMKGRYYVKLNRRIEKRK